jgi:hypothetical protein
MKWYWILYDIGYDIWYDMIWYDKWYDIWYDIGSIFQYISNKMQRYKVYLYLETVLHVSGGTSTHHQERIQLYLQHLVFVTPLLLSAAIVEELEPIWVCNVASCWIYIGILLGARPIPHISKIRVNYVTCFTYTIYVCIQPLIDTFPSCSSART